MKIGLDIHNCIDLYPEIFRVLSKEWDSKGHRIYIITGQEWHNVKHKVDDAGVTYHEHFSIVDYHLATGTKMWQKNNHWWMEEKTWFQSKGMFCKSEGIDIHFDDSFQYAEFMPQTTSFILVPKQGFQKFMEVLAGKLFR